MGNTSTEYEEQETVFDWAHGYAGNIEPRLRMLHPVENTKGSGRGPAGFKYTGGIPDMALPVAVHPFHGLYIELKTKSGKPSAVQRLWQNKLREQGYASEICYGAEAAMELIEQYLAGELPPF
jgi:hypothetical protein